MTPFEFNLIGDEFFDIMAMNSFSEVKKLENNGELRSTLVMIDDGACSSIVLYDANGGKKILSSRIYPSSGASMNSIDGILEGFVAEGTTVIEELTGRLLVFVMIDIDGSIVWSDANGGIVNTDIPIGM